ncbi:hypothetical protein NB693_20780 [Pantoea ananatis]|uniref:hypothetical protein n=1 Tax=Pantoea ananas TaxID=553 RepID=UPI00222104CC|nr:hypothetical protein [Pantoea ananatis]
MIAMTLRAFLRQPRKPVLFQPIYVGYEKLMEGNSYLDELSGRPKEKESIWALLWGIPKVLKQNYGQVVVNFGEPIPLSQVLAQRAPEWDGQPLGEDEKPAWLNGTVDALAQQIQVHINAAADVNPVNLLALALLSTPKHAMGEADLIAQIELCKKLLAELPYSDRVTVTPHSPERIIAHAEEINVLTRTPHPLGDVLSVNGDNAVLLSYFRNNVLHLFTASSWVACCFQNNRRMSRAGLLRLGRTVYPFLQAELFLPWVRRAHRTHHRGVRARRPAAAARRGRRQRAGAQHRPDRRGVPPARHRPLAATGVRALLHENSKLVFDERLDAWAKDAKFILGRELRHTIERVSPEAAKVEETPVSECVAGRVATRRVSPEAAKVEEPPVPPAVPALWENAQTMAAASYRLNPSACARSSRRRHSCPARPASATPVPLFKSSSAFSTPLSVIIACRSVRFSATGKFSTIC